MPRIRECMYVRLKAVASALTEESISNDIYGPSILTKNVRISEIFLT